MSNDIIISTAEENDQPIEVLDLSVRSYNCLKRIGIRTISQIFALSKNELLSVRNLGIVGYNEVREKLIQLGYMDPEQPGGPFAEELSTRAVKPCGFSPRDRRRVPFKMAWEGGNIAY